MTPDLIRAEQSAVKLLLAQSRAALPVPVNKLELDFPVIIDSMLNYCRVTNTSLERLSEGSDCLRDGCTIICHRRGKPVYLVLYNQSERNRRRISFTLAHEIGHIILGHTKDEDTEEQEANAFAAGLLIPRVLARELCCRISDGSDMAAEMAELFGISLMVARRRLARTRAKPTQLEEKLLLRYGPLLPERENPAIYV